LGDTTPETFYDNISNADIADGLIPRLQIVEYTGERTPRNRNAGHPPPEALSRAFAEVVMQALTMQSNRACVTVQHDAEGLALLDAFDEECAAHMRGATTGERQLWNRAHLKALRLAALLAVGCSPHSPCVTAELAQWAIAFTRAGTERILARFTSGDVGTGDARTLAELKRLVVEYLQTSTTKRKSYGVTEKLAKADDVVPYSYLVVRANTLTAFKTHRNGSAFALRATIETALQTDMLLQVPATEALGKFGVVKQALYRVSANWLGQH
jgi:hypothetical protein